MTIEINGMAHVMLTVSRFEVARAFYGELLPQFGMKVVFLWRPFILLCRRQDSDRHSAMRSGLCRPALCSATGGTSPSLSASAFA